MESKLFKVISPYKSPYPDPIIFKKGEKVKIGKKFEDDPEWKDWLWCEGENNNKAWTPKQFIDISGSKGIINLYYNARELSIDTGEILIISEIVNGFGFAEKENGEKGWAPIKNLEILNP